MLPQVVFTYQGIFSSHFFLKHFCAENLIKHKMCVLHLGTSFDSRVFTLNVVFSCLKPICITSLIATYELHGSSMFCFFSLHSSLCLSFLLSLGAVHGQFVLVHPFTLHFTLPKIYIFTVHTAN